MLFSPVDYVTQMIGLHALKPFGASKTVATVVAVILITDIRCLVSYNAAANVARGFGTVFHCTGSERYIRISKAYDLIVNISLHRAAVLHAVVFQQLLYFLKLYLEISRVDHLRTLIANGDVSRGDCP